MSVKITGFDEFEKNLSDLQNKVEELAQEQSVSFDVLFDNGFMESHTEFSTFNDLLLAGHYEVHSQEDFESIPQSEFDDFISNHTPFDNWEDMLSSATTEYLTKQFNSFIL